MSIVTDTPADALVVEEEDRHDHPSDLLYVKIALILAVITAVEVGTYFIEEASATLLLVVLLPMMMVKFLIVAGYFMHLKFDSRCSGACSSSG